MNETTLAIIKPDAVRDGHAVHIIAILSSRFRIVRAWAGSLTILQTKDLYREHQGQPFYGVAACHMLSGPVVALVCTGFDAVAELRRLIGYREPREADPGTIRRTFGTWGERNAIHAADSVQAAKREIGVVFGDE